MKVDRPNSFKATELSLQDTSQGAFLGTTSGYHVTWRGGVGRSLLVAQVIIYTSSRTNICWTKTLSLISVWRLMGTSRDTKDVKIRASKCLKAFTGQYSRTCNKTLERWPAMSRPRLHFRAYKTVSWPCFISLIYLLLSEIIIY